MIYLFNVIQFFNDFNFEFIREAFEFLILSALYANDLEFFKALVFGLEYFIIKIERVLWQWRWLSSGFWGSSLPLFISELFWWFDNKVFVTINALTWKRFFLRWLWYHRVFKLVSLSIFFLLNKHFN